MQVSTLGIDIDKNVFQAHGVDAAGKVLITSTQLINALRAHLAELGLVAAQGWDGVKFLVSIVRDTANQLPGVAQSALQMILNALQQQIGEIERQIQAPGIERATRANGWRPYPPWHHRCNRDCRHCH